LKYLSTIAKAAKDGDWRAALEYLKRRDRANWGDNVDVTSGNEKLTDIGLKLIDYRTGIAEIESGPASNNVTPSQDKSLGDGA
jgi:hypothetical protein